ncbi:hypothetical protein CJD36_020400 [Flavipsychrobacter stenotrophus]|uniref:Carboxypeptidase regulatory-like domain-containing protein n=1 Tax=Flavipsychrobacter stenotrophus TaxID=2077091 RepID=A0A2S7SQX9_9BACT|nr:carboxypeptidase-like regulatory domain-containing protein [Flavipsychrobacter stenotrophus]PQJ09154.1 hypothetical protein CJD36_020400 [Flavipsychrobacter stenotrophus]
MNFKLQILSLLLVSTFYATAQQINGIITDSMKHPIVNASVAVRQNGIVVGKNNTDSNGRYILNVVNAGYYNLTASKQGLQTITILKLIVGPNEKTEQNFTLLNVCYHKGILKKNFIRPFSCDNGHRHRNYPSRNASLEAEK